MFKNKDFYTNLTKDVILNKHQSKDDFKWLNQTFGHLIGDKKINQHRRSADFLIGGNLYAYWKNLSYSFRNGSRS